MAGADPMSDFMECPVCNGEGTVYEIWGYSSRDGEPVGIAYRCHECNGTGVVDPAPYGDPPADGVPPKLRGIARGAFLAGAAAVGFLLALAAPGHAGDDDWCMPWHMPGPGVSTTLPAGAEVVYLPLARIIAAGRAARAGQAAEVTRAGGAVYGFADAGNLRIVLPRRGDLPDRCWRAIRDHEAAHLNRWTHP